MKTSLYPHHLLKLIDVLKRLPGVGSKSAERYAFQMLDWNQEHLEEMAETIRTAPSRLRHCPECGCLVDPGACTFCQEQRHTAGTICIVASPRDVFSIEETNEYKGLYHVLGGVLSPLDGVGPEKLRIGKLKERMQSCQTEEAVIALDSTLEGDATSLFLKQELEPIGLKISRIAFGVPIGSSLDYVDGGTLARAFSGRARF